MDTKIKVGQENIYFEMESKQEDHTDLWRCSFQEGHSSGKAKRGNTAV